MTGRKNHSLTDSAPTAAIAERLAQIQTTVRNAAAGRPVRLIGVAKRFDLAAIQQAAAAGLKDVGESYAQEAAAKWSDPAMPGLIRHFIGPLQSNKLKLIAAHADWLHSLCTLKHGLRLSRLVLEADRPPMAALIQVNITGEASKHGIAPEQAGEFLAELTGLKGLSLRGLMCIGRLGDSVDQNRASFSALRELRDSLQTRHPALTELSMGMSGDFPAAIAEGATMVRIGTRLFGARPEQS